MNAYHLFTVYKGLPAVRGAALSYFFQKLLALEEIILYTMKCCDMIAMKREVAAPKEGGFSVERMSRGRNDLQTWRQVTVQIYRKFLHEQRYAAGRKSVEPESGRDISRKETHG